MKKLILNTFVCCLLFSLSACNDDNNCNCSGEIYGKWEVTKMLSLESAGYSKTDDYNPTIEFTKDGTIGIRLDRNSCFGDFEIGMGNSINIANGGCTEACCDSDFSSKFASMLSQVGSYAIEGDILKLNISGWGWYELEFISN